MKSFEKTMLVLDGESRDLHLACCILIISVHLVQTVPYAQIMTDIPQLTDHRRLDVASLL